MAVCGFVQPAPLFPIWIVAGDRGIQEVRLGDPAPGCLRNDRDPVVLEAARQLEAYFRGDLREFDLPLAATGTPFQHRVWEALRRIPYGETCTYQDLATELKSAARAIGQANGSNPIGIIVPCHRVIQA